MDIKPQKCRSFEDGHLLTYLIPRVPDASCWQTQTLAGGDVMSAVFAGWEGTLRHVSNMGPETLSMEHLFVFNSKYKNHDRQSRMRMYFRVQSPSREIVEAMRTLIERGENSLFYKFEECGGPLDYPQSLSASCDIIRRRDFLIPLHSCDLNPKIPDSYYVISPFTANEKNNLRTLDRVLDRVTEPVVISVRVQPTDVFPERHAVTDVMESYYLVNHGRDLDDQGYAGLNYTGDDDCKSFSLRRLELVSLKDPTADHAWHCLKPIYESMASQPMLFFSIRVMAKTEATARMIAGVFAEAAFKKGDYRLVTSKRGKRLFDDPAPDAQQFEIAPFPVFKYVSHEQESKEYSELERLVQLATVDELKGAVRLPAASSFSPILCMRRSTDPVYQDPKKIIVVGHNLQGIEDNPDPIPVGWLLEELRKHVGIFAMSGSGKTTLNIDILYQLFERGIPFIVIETSKTELRVIKLFRNHKKTCYRKLAEQLQVLTLGNEECSPMRSNPLEVPPGVEQKVHIVRQKECFAAFMPVFPALPGILSEAMQRSYANHPDPHSPPIIADLYKDCVSVLSEKSYCGEVSSNIKGALDVRLGELTRLIAGDIFKCRSSIPSVADLMSSYTIIEMDRLPRDQKCLMALTLLYSLLEYVQCLPPADGLRLVVVIEELHNIFGQTGEARPSEEAPNPMAYVVALLNHLLVEFRARGVGIILTDQHPSNLSRSAETFKLPLS